MKVVAGWRKAASVVAMVGAAFVVVLAANCQCGDPPGADAGPQLIGSGDPITDGEGEGDPNRQDAGPVVCDDDDNEDNDARTEATSVNDGVVRQGRACGGDDDWYSVDSAPGCDVDARMTQQTDDDTVGDIDILLFDPDGTLVGSSSTSQAEEAVHVPATKTGTYALRLRPGARDNVPYTLNLTSTCAADLQCPADDTNEENDNASQATSLVEGVASAGILCGLDEDWFQNPVSQGCIADARADFVHAQGDIDFELYRGDGITRVGASDGVQNEERLVKVITEGGMAFRVFFFNSSADKVNTFHVAANEICQGQLACPSDDPFEPNDTKDTGAELFAAKDEAIGAMCGDDDFYEVTPTAGCTLHATLALSFPSDQGDLDLEVQKKSDGSVLTQSVTTTQTEQVDFTAPDASPVVLRVLGFNGGSNVYRLHVEQDCP